MKTINKGSTDKEPSLGIVTTEKISSKNEEFIIPPEYKGKKLICRVWNDTGKNTMPVVLSSKKVKYGKPDFSAKIGGKDRFFRINYRTKGLIKQIGKKLYYDTHFLNTTGGMSFYQFPEDMDSDEAYTAFKNNAVDMYVKKGGIPMMYLLVAIVGMTVMSIAFLFILPPALQAQDEVKQLDLQVTEYKKQLIVKDAQIQALQTGGNIG